MLTNTCYYICIYTMVQDTQHVDAKPFSMTLKMNAKREFYGEFTVKADNIDDLEKNLALAGGIFMRHVQQ